MTSRMYNSYSDTQYHSFTIVLNSDKQVISIHLETSKAYE